MINVKKLLVTLIMTAMICSSFGGAAFAESTEGTSGTQIQDTNTTTDTATTVTESTTALPQKEQTLEEGYFMDEQGQIYYDESLINSDSTEVEEDSDAADSTVDSEDDADEADTEVEDTEDTEVTTEKDSDKADADKKDDSKSKEEKEPAYSKSDLRLLSCLIYAEAGNQSYSAQLAVANIVLNRVKSDVYWHVKTIKDVIYDDKWAVQFSVTIENSKGVSPLDKALKAYDAGKYSGGNPEAEEKAMKQAIKAAKAALNGKNNIGSYLCFSNKGLKKYVKKHYTKYKIIDDLIFYRKE